jgi:hypothetical protein
VQYPPTVAQNHEAGATVTATMPAPPAVGNTIIAWSWSYGPSGQSEYFASNLTDSAGNTYMLAAEVHTLPTGCDGSGSSAAAIYAATAITASADPFVVTVAPSGPPPQALALEIAEYTGLTVVDQSHQTLVDAAPSPMTITTGQTAPTTADHELLVAVGTGCAGYPDMVMWTDNAGFSVLGVDIETVSNEPGIAADRIVTTTGAYGDSWTYEYTGNTNPALAAIATLR